LERLAQQIAPGHVASGGESSVSEAMSVLLSESYSGTFPHPDVLRKLDDCVLDGAERAFALTEREQAHRHAVDNQLIEAQVQLVGAQSRLLEAQGRQFDSSASNVRLALVLAFVFLLLAAAGAFVCIMTGHPAGAGLVGGGGLLVLGAAGLLRARAGKDAQAEEGK
jgi:uncharacterized membrane protein